MKAIYTLYIFFIQIDEQRLVAEYRGSESLHGRRRVVRNLYMISIHRYPTAPL